jgi:uncharacterized LabA/DUF88 family protein
MQFVDGENLTISAQKLIKLSGRRLIAGSTFREDCFFWPGTQVRSLGSPENSEPRSIRSYYYTTCVGSEEVRDAVRQQLWTIGFEPHVFKKDKQTRKTKGVDIALTKDMLSHAFRGNYEVVRLIAGDGDYVPLVEEVKRLGKRVDICFIGDCVSPDLRLAADRFIDLMSEIQTWGFHERNSVAITAKGE